MKPAPPVLWDIVEEALDEAEFRSLSWGRALASAKYTIAEVAQGPEERFNAQVDAVVVGGIDAVERLLLPALESEEPPRVLAAALAVCRIPGAPIEGVLRAIEETSDPSSLAAARGLALADHPLLEQVLFGLLEHGDPKVQVAAAKAIALRGLEPGRRIERLLSSPVASVRAAALLAARDAGPKAHGLVLGALEADEAEVREAAVETGLVLGLRPAWEYCRKLARTSFPDAGSALTVLAMSGDPSDAPLIEAALEASPLRAWAVWALGLLGTRRAADRCVELLADPAVGGLAGESFCAITGFLPSQPLQAPTPKEADDDDSPPQGDEPGQALRAHLAKAALAELPWLKHDMVAKWWSQARERFDPQGRHIAGAPLTFETLRESFALTSTRRRRALALELEVRSGGTWRVSPNTWAVEQLRYESKPIEVPPRGDLPFGVLLQSPW